MGSLEGSRFEKKRRYPSSQTLLSYYRSSLSDQQTPQVAFHLATCDFRAAELQLLSRYPSAEESCKPATMPPHLGALAEALMKKDCSRTEAWIFGTYETAMLAEPLGVPKRIEDQAGRIC